jgi:hypothetical protein
MTVQTTLTRNSYARARARPPTGCGGRYPLPATRVPLAEPQRFRRPYPRYAAAAGYSRRMGIWDRLKAALISNRTTDAIVELVPAQQPGHGRDDPQVANVNENHDLPQGSGDEGARRARAFYDAEKARAKAAGVTMKSYRAGYVSAETVKEQLAPGPDGRPPLRLVSSDNGLDLALPSGQLVDYKTLALRHFSIFAFRVVGMGYYEDEDRPRRYRNGERLGILREPDNEHDANAVALTAGRPAAKIGYVNKQRAKWVAELLDSGQELSAIVIQTKSSPRALITTPEMLAYLQRS